MAARPRRGAAGAPPGCRPTSPAAPSADAERRARWVERGRRRPAGARGLAHRARHARAPATRPTPWRRWPPPSPACASGSSSAPTSSRSCPAGAIPTGSSPPRAWPRCAGTAATGGSWAPWPTGRPRPRGLARRARDRRLVQHDPRADGRRAAHRPPRPAAGRGGAAAGGSGTLARGSVRRRKDPRDLPARADPGRRRRRGIEERQGHRDPRHAGPGGLHRLPRGLHRPDARARPRRSPRRSATG